MDKPHHGKTQDRDTTGRYGFDGKMERVCVCGHRLGLHAAPNAARTRPCFNEDTGLGGSGEACSCLNFRLTRKKGGDG